MGFRHGKNREVFETGFVYDGLWEDGMVEVNQQQLGADQIQERKDEQEIIFY